MTTITNTFAGGTNGTGITTGNSGGASGTAFDVIDAAFGGTCTYDNTHTHLSSLAGEYQMAGAAVATTGWNTSLTATSITQAWFRFYIYMAASLNGRETICQNDVTSGFGSFLDITTAGTVQFLDSGGTTRISSTATISSGSWARVEGFILSGSGTGQLEFKLFLLPDSATPTETQTSAATLTTGNPTNGLLFGLPNGAHAEQIWLEGLGASDTGYIGPILPPVTGHAAAPDAPGDRRAPLLLRSSLWGI